jgi:hypothetical protein
MHNNNLNDIDSNKRIERDFAGKKLSINKKSNATQ